MQETITRAKIKRENGYLCKQILGLQLFHVNEQLQPFDPFLIMLRVLAADYRCSAHINHDQLEGVKLDSGTPIIRKNAFVRTPVGICTAFYCAAEAPSYWVNSISEKDLTDDADEFLWDDEFAIYVSKGAAKPFDPQMRCKDNNQFHEYWIKHCLQSFDLIGASIGDGWYPTFYAREESDFAILQKSISTVEDKIRSSEWFRQNSARLRWDEQKGCLVIK